MRRAARKAQLAHAVNGTWAGGIVRGGRWVIREQHLGRRWTFTTRARSEEEALAELARFREDPVLYAKSIESRRREATAHAVMLDDATKLAFLKWTRDVKKRSDRYCHDLKVYLTWWQERIGGIDLRARGLTLDRLTDALEGSTAELQRTAAIKVFLSYLRKKGKLSASDDPTLFGALPVPQPTAAQRTKSKVVPREHIDLVIEHLGSRTWRDALIVQGGTMWRVTEVMRFAESGRIEPIPRSMAREGEAAILVCPRDKRGGEKRTRVSARTLDAAKRVLEHGAFSREHYDRAIRAACKVVKRPDGEIGIPEFTPAMLRHTGATLALEAGENPAAISEQLGHSDPRTRARFYTLHGSAPKTKTLF